MPMSKRRPRESQEAGWEFLASELRDRRLAAGLTQEELGERVFVSASYIGAFEAVRRRPSPELAAQIDAALETDGFFERLSRKLLDESPYESYFTKIAELETLATKICEHEVTLVPGLLQTPTYARAVMQAAAPYACGEELSKRVAARMERARIFKGPGKPEHWAIVHENALRIPVGGAACMAEQLDHLAALVRGRQTVIQVIPCAQGAHAAMSHPMKLMHFADGPPIVYTEALFWGRPFEEPAMVRRATATYDLLRAAALSPEASLSLIESAAESYRAT
ncbi:Scr1 family TA system antitoxin-like transcriptional regulator [Streptomyces sp. NPDC101227]|uniref:helix-turn-helix domain-containing protein n=1 Tax=Streptomyces sp. NPDC101227 TaxID=3366136 RepID=UPI00382EA7E0